MQCRACMQTNGEEIVNMSCAISADGKTLYDYFNDCTQLEATSTDNLPKLLCVDCTQSLRSAYNFRQGARRSDKEFKKILELQKIEPELIYANTEQADVLEDSAECSYDPLDVPDEQSAVVESSTSLSRPELEMPAVDIKIEIAEEFCDESNENQIVKQDLETCSHDEEDDENEVQKGRATHNCNLCDRSYTTQKDLKSHIFELHKTHIICMKCPKVYELPSELQLHESLVHGTESPLQCPWCNDYFSRDELTKHLRKKHGNSYLKYFPRTRPSYKESDGITPFRCEVCHKYYSSVLELANHLQEHTFDCPICSMSFKKHGTFRAHVKRIHNHSISSLKAMIEGSEQEDKPFECSLCSGKFRIKRTLQNHMKLKHNQNLTQLFEDDEDKLYECSICNMRFRSQSSVYYHKRRKHRDLETSATDDGNNVNIEMMEQEETESSEFIRCKYCHKEIAANQIKYHEKRHVYTINKKSRYLCSYCPRVYNSETSVKIHEKKIHLCEKPEPKECPICQKKVDPKYLKHHIENVHTSERKFICDVCGDSFKSYVLLHSHKRLHLERNFPCTVCPKKFIRSFDLKVHMRIHTGEEPYACHICDRRFKIKVRLNYHLQRHAGIKRKCKDCGKEFNHVKQLKIHSYKHTGMPYRCSVCNYACAQRDVFRKHLLRMHDMTMTPDEYCAMFKANTGRYPHVKTLEELQLEARNVEEEDEDEEESD